LRIAIEGTQSLFVNLRVRVVGEAEERSIDYLETKNQGAEKIMVGVS